MSIGDFVEKAKEFAQANPDKVHDALEKIEGLVNEQTGNQHASQVEKAAGMIEKQLGIQGHEGQQEPPAAQ